MLVGSGGASTGVLAHFSNGRLRPGPQGRRPVSRQARAALSQGDAAPSGARRRPIARQSAPTPPFGPFQPTPPPPPLFPRPFPREGRLGDGLTRRLGDGPGIDSESSDAESRDSESCA